MIKGYIYLLHTEDGYSKIGLTTNLKRRVHALKIQLPFPVVLRHAVPVLSNLYQAERYIHHIFRRHRMNGEWFNLPTEDVEWFCSLHIGDIDVMMNGGPVRREWVTWDFLCELEPRLKDVERLARKLGSTNRESYTRPFYQHIKPQVFDLVGRHSGRPELLMLSSAAYDTAYLHLLDLTMPYVGEPEQDEEDYWEYDV